MAENLEERAIHFTQLMRKKGVNPYVDVPENVSKAFGKRGHIPIKGTLNGFPIRATLVPVGKARHCLYINRDMRKAAGMGVGDSTDLVLEIDASPRSIDMQKALRDALDLRPQARAKFEKLNPSRQREILAYLLYLKTPEALERNIAKVISSLEGSQ